ncbi:hypothetical protein MXB_1438 [Myxobolus squamalis]|nr:hypothetical protein MXB_1438 [Myxobolus squamalis]
MIITSALISSHDWSISPRKPKKSPQNYSVHTLDASNPKESRALKILCLSLTHPSKENYVKSVLKTWGPKCDKLLFASRPLKIRAPMIQINITEESRENLWIKVRQSFIQIHDKLIDQFDWFLKLDDDTYIIMENLRHFLSQYDTDLPYFFGKYHDGFGGFHSGGGGYILSRKSLRLFSSLIKKYSKFCPINHEPEDTMMAKCLRHMKVYATKSLDKFQYELFSHLKIFDLIIPDLNYMKYGLDEHTDFPRQNGPDCCSRYTISSHYINPWNKYHLHFLLYNVHQARNFKPNVENFI